MKTHRSFLVCLLVLLAAILWSPPLPAQSVRETNAGGVSVKASVVTKTSNYTATEDDYTILVNAAAAAVTINLPRTSRGRVYVVKKIDASANAVTIDANQSQTIDGSTTLVLSSQYDVAYLHASADGALGSWFNLERRAEIVEARTATASGATTGTISPASTHVTVTSSDANHIIILPAPVVGKKLTIHAGATGFELRSSAPASIAINAGSGADAESAIAAASTCYLECVTATAWKGFFLDADSDVAKIPAAAP
jgi:hypothetical protein